ncbi:MAG: hypothetical protein R3B96_25575 [Pirellulaceae bacterium]
MVAVPATGHPGFRCRWHPGIHSPILDARLLRRRASPPMPAWLTDSGPASMWRYIDGAWRQG